MAGERYRLALFGPPRLEAPSGRDATPALRKSVALLAFLALAEGRPVGRDRLQALLWSDRMQPQGRDSLKKALGDIRRAFDELPACPLESDGGPVRLRLDRIDVDALGTDRAPDGDFFRPALLEGLDLREPAFCRWLDEIRARIARPHASHANGRLHLPVGGHTARHVRIGIPPPRTGGIACDVSYLARMAVAGLKRALQITGVFEVIDLREQDTPPAGAGVDLLLKVGAMGFPGEAMLDLSLTTFDGSSQIWSTGERIELAELTPASLNARLATMADQIAERVHSARGLFGERHAAARSALRAIFRMFRLSNADLDSADHVLGEVSEALGTSSLYAWHAYLTAFRVEKKGRTNAADVIDRAEYLAARAYEIDPTNPLTRALVAHVQSFVLRDLDAAREMLEPVRNMTSQSVMLADTFGLVRYYSGDYAEAKRHAGTACALGKWHPFRYAFTTSVAMSELMLGDYAAAAATSRRALAQHPIRSPLRYEPTLRTLAAAYALDGRLDDGRAVLLQLEQQSGKGATEALTTPADAPFPNAEVFVTVKRGLERLYA